MKRLALCAILGFAAVAFSATAYAAGNGTDHQGPFAGTTTDGGSCGNSRAQDTYNISFNVHDNGNGTFDVKAEYKDGSFVTLAGDSPGACETTNRHGSTLAAGISGRFQGSVSETVASASYNPAACTPALCSTRTGFITTAFAAPVPSNVTFNFEYDSSDKTLTYRHWQDKSDNAGNDQFVGDIANQ